MSPALSPARRALIDAVLEAKRQEHRELRAPLLDRGLMIVLRREGVALLVRPHPRDSELLPIAGRWTIIVDRGQERSAWLVLATHELGHLWLHHDLFFPRHETSVYDQSPPWYDELREAEADYLAELLIAGPVPVAGKSKPVRKTRRQSAASNVPLATRKAAPPRPLPGWLEEVERDADSVRLKEAAVAAQRAYAREKAPLHDPAYGPSVQFAIGREAWAAIRFDQLPGAYPHYTNLAVGTNHEFVTCSLAAAERMIPMLFHAGHKRTAVFLRRRVRDALARDGSKDRR